MVPGGCLRAMVEAPCVYCLPVAFFLEGAPWPPWLPCVSTLLDQLEPGLGMSQLWGIR